MGSGHRGDIPLNSATLLTTHPPLASLQSLELPSPFSSPDLGTSAPSTFPSAASSQIHCAGTHLPVCPHFLLSPLLSWSPSTTFSRAWVLSAPPPASMSPPLLPCLLPCVVPSSLLLFPPSLPLLLSLNPFLSIPADFPVFFYLSLIVLGSLLLCLFLSVSGSFHIPSMEEVLNKY